MKSLLTVGVLLALATGAPATASRSLTAVAPLSTAGAVVVSAPTTDPTVLAMAPRTTPDAVEPAERVSEPEGAFGFARILLGLLVAAIVGAAVWLGSRYARRRREGGRPRDR